MADKAIHALEGDVRVAPRLHWKMGVRGFELNGGKDANAGGGLGDWRRRLQMRRQGGKVQNPRGKPFGFIGATDARKPTVRLDLRACHDLPQRHAMGYAHAIPILSCGKITGHFTSLGGPGLVKSKRNIDQNRIYGPFGPRSLTIGPSTGPTAAPHTPTKGGKSWAPQMASA